MNYSFSRMIDVSERSSIGLSDSMTFVAIRVQCLADACANKNIDMCRLKDLIDKTNIMLGEHKAKLDIDDNLSLVIIFNGRESYFEFLKALDFLMEKWEAMDVFSLCQCTLRKELITIREKIVALLNSQMPANLKH